MQRAVRRRNLNLQRSPGKKIPETLDQKAKKLEMEQLQCPAIHTLQRMRMMIGGSLDFNKAGLLQGLHMINMILTRVTILDSAIRTADGVDIAWMALISKIANVHGDIAYGVLTSRIYEVVVYGSACRRLLHGSRAAS